MRSFKASTSTTCTATRLGKLLRFFFSYILFSVIISSLQDAGMASRAIVSGVCWSFARHPSLALVVFRLRLSAFPSTCNNTPKKARRTWRYHLRVLRNTFYTVSSLSLVSPACNRVDSVVSRRMRAGMITRPEHANKSPFQPHHHEEISSLNLRQR